LHLKLLLGHVLLGSDHVDVFIGVVGDELKINGGHDVLSEELWEGGAAEFLAVELEPHFLRKALRQLV